MSIAKKLLNIKNKVSSITKDGEGHNYKYATPKAVLETLNPLLNEEGLVLISKVVSVTTKELSITNKFGKTSVEILFGLNMIMTWIDSSNGETLEVPWYGAGCNGLEQGFGSALTYAERYFLLKQFNIPQSDDDPDAVKAKRGDVTVGKVNINDIF